MPLSEDEIEQVAVMIAGRLAKSMHHQGLGLTKDELRTIRRMIDDYQLRRQRRRKIIDSIISALGLSGVLAVIATILTYGKDIIKQWLHNGAGP